MKASAKHDDDDDDDVMLNSYDATEEGQEVRRRRGERRTEPADMPDRTRRYPTQCWGKK
ncbi:hypothetical protein RDWZM_003801 [Blomia tropicalis]|uniref:Uncharacterized protein n=1 Tax=Blomia tropicalis TaxID=40697 RepID=A0A9Q0MG43_BLOTA|nr:hypothetical protein RDWZM_003801 [Blomia tropicalis]